MKITRTALLSLIDAEIKPGDSAAPLLAAPRIANMVLARIEHDRSQVEWLAFLHLLRYVRERLEDRRL